MMFESGYPYYWRVRKYLPERWMMSCVVLARGKKNTVLVEFPDGYKVTTSGWFVRKRKELVDAKKES